MKMNFRFDLSAESGKITTEDFSGELGAIKCPIELDVEFEASEATQLVGLLKEAIKSIPDMIKQQAANAVELENLRSNNAERLERLKATLAADTVDRQRVAEEKALERIRLQQAASAADKKTTK